MIRFRREPLAFLSAGTCFSIQTQPRSHEQSSRSYTTEPHPRPPGPFLVREMKQFWLELSETASEKEILRTVAEARPDVVLLPKPISGIPIKVASRLEGGDILVTANPEDVRAGRPGISIAVEVTVRDRGDHEKVAKYLELKPDYLLVDCPDWKIIPVENLIAETRGKTRLLVKTRNAEESRTLLSTLELGVDGICLDTDQSDAILKTRDMIHSTA